MKKAAVPTDTNNNGSTRRLITYRIIFPPMAPALRPDEKKSIEQAVSGDILAATVCKLYQAVGSQYQYSGLMGAMCLVSKNAKFSFELVDLKTNTVIWSHAVEGDLKYAADRAWFHSFVGKTQMIGFSFCQEDEASNFLDTVGRRNSFAKPMTKAGSASSLKEDKKSSGFSFFGRKDTKKEKKLDKSMISAPSDFKHLSHVGYDPKKGFSAQNIPVEWKIIFQKAGITEEQLQDKKTAKIVAKFMKEHAGAAVPQAQSNQGSPQATRRAPPVLHFKLATTTE
ncbi:hypothetical protein EDD86DRAFT_97151 [Gorgonomyces haynaldii]|nr:hypothetical protein EDD86DRAFT_97151 [Gorgonomyces haynaldii]